MARPHTLAGGRPPLPPEDARSEAIRVRTTPAEADAIRAAAQAAGVSISDWARGLLVRAARRSPRA